MVKVKKINNVMVYVPIDHITELNETFFVSATMVTKGLVKSRIEAEEPP